MSTFWQTSAGDCLDTPMATHEVIDRFRDAIAAAGITPPDHIEADGELHRFSTNGKTSDKAGYYCLHLDGVAAGHFGCWRQGIGQDWSARNGARLDRAELAKLSESIRQREAEGERRQAARAQVAQTIWDAAQPAQDSHPYLMRKGVRVAGEIRQADVSRAEFFGDDAKTGTMENCLLVKVEDAEGLQSLQAITPEGAKPFMGGAKKAEGCTILPGEASTLYIVEGLATGLSIHQSTGATVAVAFDSGNLPKVAKRMKAEAPGARLIIAGDNDHESDKNPGKAAADKAAADTGAEIALSPDESGVSDWNDYHAAHGLESVREALEGREKADADAMLDALEGAKAKNLLAVEPPPMRYVVDGLLPEPIAAAVVAPGSTGKSFWLMQLAACVCTGVPFMGQAIPNPGAVLMLGAEDDADEISRRLHSIVREYEWDGDRLDPETLGERFYAFPLVGQDNRLVKDGERDEAKINAIINMARAITDLRLIILDPVSRFRSGEENSNDDNTRFAEALEHIRKETGVTVLVAHHSRKGSNGDSADDVRGGSAFVDALRFVATLAKLPFKEAERLGMSPEDAANLIRFTVVKANYKHDMVMQWMRRGMGGVLKPTDPPEEPPKRTEAKGEERYSAALPKLRDLVRQKDEEGKPLTRRALREYAGQAGLFGMGDQSLRGVLSRAIEEGQVIAHEDGTLRLW
ncbi:MULTISPECIES: AAA family ATPase [Halomonas]|uniref:Toprim domain-containing protein n=1 Tax=Halomonas halophila TaxID=29573 RepID=A0ABQ0U3C4_9GAMM|nr:MULTISPECIES: AAA family ATPase [Halomonas]MDR5890294.1 AAA family ATPase [Halomonas salina]WJY05788.1 AAA family ATPase [Halomonas halophila]GEK72950.1 hypothetical protein HHA04nite_14940 [Halomonas halophila]